MPGSSHRGTRRLLPRRHRARSRSLLLALPVVLCALLALPMSAAASGAAPAPATASAATTAATAVAEWPQLQGGPAHTGVAGADPTLDLAGLQNLHTVWSHPVNEQAGTYGGAVISGGLAYIVDNGLTAYQVSTGALAWHTTLPITLASTPAVGDGVVVVAGELNAPPRYRGAALGLDALTGQLLWTRRLPGTAFTAPAIVRGAALVTAGHTVVKLRLTSGRIVWTSPVVATSPPTIVGDQVFVSDQDPAGSDPLTVSSVDLASGAVRWTRPLSAQGGCGAYEDGTVAVSDGVAYAGDCYGVLTALHTQGGAPLWRIMAPPVFFPLAVTTTGVVTATDDATAVDRATGTVLWSEPSTATQSSGPSPVVVGTTLVLALENGLGLRDPSDGTDLGDIPLDGQTSFTAVGEGHVIVVVFDVTTGQSTLVALAPAG